MKGAEIAAAARLHLGAQHYASAIGTRFRRGLAPCLGRNRISPPYAEMVRGWPVGSHRMARNMIYEPTKHMPML
jgi:hypothetical protein